MSILQCTCKDIVYLLMTQFVYFFGHAQPDKHKVKDLTMIQMDSLVWS